MIDSTRVSQLLSSMGFETGPKLPGLGTVLAVKDAWGGALLDDDAGVAVLLADTPNGFVPTVAWHINHRWVCSQASEALTPDDFRRAVFARVACYFAALAADWSAKLKRARLEDRRSNQKRWPRRLPSLTESAA